MKTRTNKVLIPVDGSEFSLQVLPYVMRFSAPEKSELILLHVAEVPSSVRLENSDNEEPVIYIDREVAALEAAFQASMQPQVDKLTQAGFKVTTVLRFGEPTAEIERLIDEEQVGLVAMTTHGRTGLARMLLGSVAQHLIQHAAVPVLLIRSFEKTGVKE
jgi:nucleotide-binding universal stress UspA family protein